MASEPARPEVDVENAKQRIRDLAAEGVFGFSRPFGSLELVLICFAVGLLIGKKPSVGKRLMQGAVRALLASKAIS